MQEREQLKKLEQFFEVEKFTKGDILNVLSDLILKEDIKYSLEFSEILIKKAGINPNEINVSASSVSESDNEKEVVEEKSHFDIKIISFTEGKLDALTGRKRLLELSVLGGEKKLSPLEMLKMFKGLTGEGDIVEYVFKNIPKEEIKLLEEQGFKIQK